MSHPSLTAQPKATIPFYRDTRMIALISQVIFVLLLVLVIAFFYNNVREGLRANGRTFSWNFLRQTAGFAIAEGPTFLPSDTYARAFFTGAVNTLRVAVVGIVLATILGLLIGIARLSTNWLLRTLAGVYIEIIRNTPALVQLFFWYFAVILTLPDIRDAATVGDLAIISNRGVELTWPLITEAGWGLSWWLWGALVAAILAGYGQQQWRLRQGKLGGGFGTGLLTFLLVALIGFGVTWVTAQLPEQITYELRRGDRGTLYVDVNGNGQFDNGIDRPMRHVPVTLLTEDGTELATTRTDNNGGFVFFELGEERGTSLTWREPAPVVISQPELQGFNIRGGLSISPEYAGILLGLVLYTAAFIAEIVRAGINAVNNGQWEASRALGLSTGETLRMIVLPQALRVAIPPLTSQYLNLTKNSSLALAVGYPDLFSISQTILNQSGAELQVFLMLMATYLSFSLITSAFTNWYNRRVALVER
jgi:general L-amino acid transport system permease protein